MESNLLYLNEAARLVYELNAAGSATYGAEHRLGSREMDMIATALSMAVKRHEERLAVKAKQLFGCDISHIIEA